MQTRTLWLCLVAVLLLSPSCGVLEQEPQARISTDQAFLTESNARSALNGLYNEVQSIYDWRQQAISDVASDVVQAVDTWDAFINLDEYRATQDNSEVEDFYTILYRAVDIANHIIARVPALQLPADLENDLIGQAYCLRGLMYFELARFWGGVPGAYGQLGVVIRTEPSDQINGESFGARASLAQTYAQVQADLENALALLPETRGGSLPDRSRVVKATARALLSRLHLYLREYAKSAQYADAVIADARYALVKPYSAIFRTKNSAESVFEMQYGTNDVSGLRNWYFPAVLGGRGGLALHEEFYAQLTADPKDERSGLVAFNASAGAYYPTKYDLAGNASNTHVIRIAELYLNRAEARAHLNDPEGARADLNAVRERAGLPPMASATDQQLLTAILEERKLEFYQEGHRWFDLLRTGNALAVLQNLKRRMGSRPVSLTDLNRQVLPFPTSEVLANPNLVQNEAYQ